MASHLPTDPILIGHRLAWGGEVPFLLHLEDTRHHTYIIGKTGSGKTTLLRNLIIQHIHRGHGVAVIDPHGDLAEDLLHHIPPSRADHLVYFDPADTDFPIGFNPLANVPLDERPLVASGIVDAFKSIWADSWGPRMQYILYNTIAALLDRQNTSLLGVNRMLIDPDYRQWVVRQIQDPFIKQFWEQEFANYDQRFLREAIAPIQNKVGALLQSPIIRNILGQVRNKVSIPFIMDDSRIFIAKLSKGRMGQDKSNLLGSLLVTQFQLAAMGRANRLESERVDFQLFIDEFQNFSTDSFASILAEARKYRLCLTLSHQYIDQLPLSIRQAVFGNVGSLIAFRVGNTDAEVLAGEFGNEFNRTTFIDLPKFQALTRLHINGQPQQPERTRMMGPINLHCAKQERLKARSRERFAAPRAKVESKLTGWLKRSE
jgi:energy-coupling factor transporter ATP-binding protein EcfA2